MGNSPSQSPGEGNEEEENKQREASASGSTSGLSMLKAGAAVAGTALLAVGTWQLLSQSSSGDAADTDDAKGKGMLVDERVKGARGGGGGGPYSQFEAFQRSSPVGRHNLHIPTHARSDQKVFKILSYNVWFEDVELVRRMRAIGDLIQEHSPDLICFQEVTPKIYEIFDNSDWGDAYGCSISPERASERKYFCMQLSKLPAKFARKRIGDSNMRRELCIAEVGVGMGRELVFAASHLVSPNPNHRHPDRMYSEQRRAQAEAALNQLKDYSNVIFGGDMNWDEEVDGPFPLPHGWVDAWEETRPGEDGFTFDTKANQMLSRHRPLQKRLDRFLCHFTDFTINSIEPIGREAIPGLSRVLPSDHYGLLLTISSL